MAKTDRQNRPLFDVMKHTGRFNLWVTFWVSLTIKCVLVSLYNRRRQDDTDATWAESRWEMQLILQKSVWRMVKSQRTPPPFSHLLHHPNRQKSVTSCFFFSAGAQSSRATCLSASPPSVRITPLKWSTLWRSPGGTMNPPPSFRDKPSTAIQISTVDSFGLQAASSYRPTLLRGAGWRGLSFDLLSCSSGDSPP